jgi:hypothetical protein
MNTKRSFPLIVTLLVLLSILAGAGRLPARAQSQAAIEAAIPELLGQVGGGAYAMVFQDLYGTSDRLFLGIGPRLYIFNVDTYNPVDPIPSLIGVSDLLPGIIRDVAIVGTRAYVALGEHGLGIINLANLAAPVVMTVYDTPGYANGLWMTAEYAYVADGASGVLILRITDPTAIEEMGSYDTPGSARDLLISEGYAFVADGPSGLRVLSVDLFTLTEVAGLDTAGYAEAVTLMSNFVYLSAGEAGLQVIKIPTPDAPGLEGSCDTPGYAQSAMYFGGSVYVADGEGGLRVINVVDKAHPTETGFYDTPGLAADLGWFEGIVLVADFSGLRIINSTTLIETRSYQSPAIPQPARRCISPIPGRGCASSTRRTRR